VNTHRGLRDLPNLWLWLGLGRAALLLTLIVCLVPMPGPILPVEGGDKYEHAIGWFLIALWYAQLTATPRALLARGCGFIAMGASIELLQAQTQYRSGDLLDLSANIAGIVAGVLLGLTPLRNVLATLDRRRSSSS
jgi:hypothetical protein